MVVISAFAFVAYAAPAPLPRETKPYPKIENHHVIGYWVFTWLGGRPGSIYLHPNGAITEEWAGIAYFGEWKLEVDGASQWWLDIRDKSHVDDLYYNWRIRLFWEDPLRPRLPLIAKPEGNAETFRRP
jgi:hypothetical protein